MADAAVGFLVENLKELILYNSDLIGGLGGSVKKLSEDLELLRAYLKDYSERQSNNEILEKFTNEVRSVIHEAEDAVESYIVLESSRKSRSGLSRAAHMLGYVSQVRDVGKQLEEISAKVTSFYQYKAPLALEALKAKGTSSRSEIKKKQMKEGFIVEEDNVVGFEDETEKVIALLTGESEHLEVVSITGMAGLGKTTLARKVFSDPVIEYRFFTRVFVTVSQDYERREVYLSILRALIPVTPEITKLPDETLAQLLDEQLKRRQYLIVMDDVWTAEVWDDLKDALPNNNRGSRVLITTQVSRLAFHANRNYEPHLLRFLTVEESRRLLRMKVFGINRCPPELEEYELTILYRCKGLPLAIVVVAGILLNHRDNINWWKKVANETNKYFGKDVTQMIDLIKLSYNQLPHWLKPCFLYLGVFPEDFEIPVGKLLRLWISEGFIQPGEGMSLEDKAESYLEDLVDMNLVMVERRRLNGQIKTCRIHGLLLDFCKMEARKENLFHVIESFDQATFPADHPSFQNCRRICINSQVSDYVTSKPSGQHVRSFLSFAKENIALPSEHTSSIPKAFRLLRVFDARSILFTRFPSELLYLVLLKYIDISCDIRILPEKISNLHYLQTIIFETSSPTLEIKANIWKMVLLRHLHTNASAYLPLPKVRGQSSLANSVLQTLSQISPESCKKEVFQRTPNLKKLGIRGKLATLIESEGEVILFDSLIELKLLENLKLLNDERDSKLHSLPHATKFPNKLKRLTLSNTSLDWKHMSTLGMLENLEVLKLKKYAFVGELWQTEEGGFHCLKVLYIESTNLTRWEASASHFPKLTSLFLRHCNKLEAIPSGLADISSLKKIDLYYTNFSVASSAKKIQQQVQDQQTSSMTSGFKLSILPPDHLSPHI